MGRRATFKKSIDKRSLVDLLSGRVARLQVDAEDAQFSGNRNKANELLVRMREAQLILNTVILTF